MRRHRESAPSLLAIPEGASDSLIPTPAWARPGAPFWAWYRLVLGGTALLHLASGVAILALSKGADFPVRICSTYTVWSNNSRSVAHRYEGTASPMGLVATFFFLSFAFQMMPVFAYRWYALMVQQGVQPLRFIEYSASSSVMVVLILLLEGVTDLWTLLLLVATNASVMLFGALQEQTTWLAKKLEAAGGPRPRWSALLPHACGWVPFLFEWSVLTALFERSIAASPGT